MFPLFLLVSLPIKALQKSGQEMQSTDLNSSFWEATTEIEDHQILEQGFGSLRPRARLLRTIGAELISSEIVAIIELVRNSYDADASKVHIIFKTPNDPDSASLEIVDDGHGMTREILLGPWMEPATNHKSSRKKGADYSGHLSPKGRRRLGSKGVGRFAAQRLGRHLIVQTFTSSSETGIQAEFDWAVLEAEEQYLDQLAIPWMQFQKEDEDERHGTSLVISRLQDEWDFDRFEKLKIALARLLGPQMGEDSFELVLEVDGAQEPIIPAIEGLPAMYQIQGEVDEDGICQMVFTDHLDTEESMERAMHWLENEKEVCGPFTFKLKAWDLDKEAVQVFLKKQGMKMGLRDFRGLIRDHSGVNLYRDGFRILPYGEPDNDWLRLDHRRVNNPTMRLSNNQLLGQIFLSAEDNPELKDQTNREGLVVNKAYEHLQRIALELIATLENRRFSVRRNLNIGPRLASASLPLLGGEVSSPVTQALEQIESSGTSEKSVTKLRSAIETWQKGTVDSIRQYAGLAATGQMAGLLLSQVSLPVQQIILDLSNVRMELEGQLLDEGIEEDVFLMLENIDKRLERLQLQMQKLDPLAKNRKSHKAEELCLVDCLEDLLTVYSETLDRSSIEYELSYKKRINLVSDDVILQQVGGMILENAIYWLGEKELPRRLKVRLLKNGYEIANNGPPIPPSAKDNIFEPHFTTRKDAAGMGLTLANDLLRLLGGRLQYEFSRKWVRFKVLIN